ncbi:transmembrane protein 94-like, partial [Choristoneura fumiferana]|uniref:transmembrane protein 94-like n=1 Tax=Choristoneura fumiferana TaxID=7141 RepID=UPI003D154685
MILELDRFDLLKRVNRCTSENQTPPVKHDGCQRTSKVQHRSLDHTGTPQFVLVVVVMSLCCAAQMARDADVSLFTLITMSRHFTASLWNSTQFWMCGVCFIAVLQVGSLYAFLPMVLSPGGAALASGSAALLGAALAFAPVDAGVMQRAGPRPQLTRPAQMILFVFWCYACKFLPSVIAILVLYGFTLRAFCEQIAAATNATACWIVYPINVGNYSAAHDLSQKSWHGWGDDFYDWFYLAQHITLALITLHLIVISLSFVHRQSSIWQKCFWSNKVWSAAVLVIIVSQTAISVWMVRARYGPCTAWALCARRPALPA